MKRDQRRWQRTKEDERGRIRRKDDEKGCQIMKEDNVKKVGWGWSDDDEALSQWAVSK